MMKMLDWGALIGEREAVENDENFPLSGEFPHCFQPVSETVGKATTSIDAAYKADSPHSPHSPLENRGGELETENESRAGGGSTVKFSDEKSYQVSPIAVCLLLACCHKIEADEQEIIESILSLMHYPPSEQVRSWAMMCNDNGIDPVQVQQLTVPSPGDGVECRGCNHLSTERVRQPSGRRVFRFVCSKHYAVLELGYAGERLLIAPPECNDYAGKYNQRCL